MDNLTHSLIGWALAETGMKRRTRKGLAACVLAANMPDIDVLFGWAPWTPLATHRGFTHGLVGGVLLMPPLLAALLWLLDRWQARRGRNFRSGLPMRFGWLVALCYLGALTHPLLDLQNTYAVQLMAPASARWFHTDGLFIVSPWLLLMLGAGLWFSRRRNRGGPVILALAGVMAFIVLNIGLSALAWRAVPPAMQADRVFAAAAPLAFWRRDVAWRGKGNGSGMIGFARFDPIVNAGALTNFNEPIRDRMNDPVVRRAAIATPEVRKFLAWSQLPFATVRKQGCATRVTFHDARFMQGAVRGGFDASASVPSGEAGCRPAR